MELKEIVLYAWVGEDEFDSSLGIKQGATRWGIVPLVSIREDRMDNDNIKNQLQRQANQYGKNIHLCRFVFQSEIKVIEPKEDELTSSAIV
jgi:hypothetical protein